MIGCLNLKVDLEFDGGGDALLDEANNIVMSLIAVLSRLIISDLDCQQIMLLDQTRLIMEMTNCD